MGCWRVSEERGRRVGELVQCYWSQRFEGRRRADRLSGYYEAFVPDPLCGWEFVIPGAFGGQLG